MSPPYQAATTSAIAQLLKARVMRPSILLELQKNDTAVNTGLALTEITSIIQKMYSECGLDTYNVRKILNDGSVIEQFEA